MGDKVEPDKTQQQALIRECHKEAAVIWKVRNVFMDVPHEYPDLTVHLALFPAAARKGMPQNLKHNDICRITVSEIGWHGFLPGV